MDTYPSNMAFEANAKRMRREAIECDDREREQIRGANIVSAICVALVAVIVLLEVAF